MPQGDYDSIIRAILRQGQQRSESTQNAEAQSAMPGMIAMLTGGPQAIQARQQLNAIQNGTGAYPAGGDQGEYSKMHDDPNYFKGR